MDVGYYISELLGQHGDVNVPGLGYFAHTRVNGYYNDSEGKFYPPGYSVQFDPQFLDHDDALALYIAQKKKISLASSKYFTDKFVQALKQQAVAGEAALADLGWFSSNNTNLLFKPNTVTGTDPEFFGYPAIPLQKIGKQPVDPQYTPEPKNYADFAVVAPVITQPGSGDQFETDEEHEEYLADLVQSKRRTNSWVFAILILALAAGAVFLTQRYDPSAFSFLKSKKGGQPVAQKVIIQDDDTLQTKTKPDTDSIPLVRNVPADSLSRADTVENNTDAFTSDPTLPRFEIIVASAYNLKEATGVIVAFKKAGLDPKIVPDAPGKRIKVSVGTFATRGLAEDKRQELLTAKKITKDAYTLPINPATKAPEVKKK